MVKSLSESTTIPLIVLSDSDDASEACTVVKNTNVKLEEVNFINTKFRFLGWIKYDLVAYTTSELKSMLGKFAIKSPSYQGTGQTSTVPAIAKKCG